MDVDGRIWQVLYISIDSNRFYVVWDFPVDPWRIHLLVSVVQAYFSVQIRGFS